MCKLHLPAQPREINRCIKISAQDIVDYRIAVIAINIAKVKRTPKPLYTGTTAGTTPTTPTATGTAGTAAARSTNKELKEMKQRKTPTEAAELRHTIWTTDLGDADSSSNSNSRHVDFYSNNLCGGGSKQQQQQLEQRSEVNSEPVTATAGTSAAAAAQLTAIDQQQRRDDLLSALSLLALRLFSLSLSPSPTHARTTLASHIT